MNTKQLHYFLTTIDKGSISGAARELEIAQPAISQQISKLEHELQAKLFLRDFRGVRLTESGVKFLTHAESIMRQINSAKLDIKNTEANPTGTVILGLNQAICNVISVPLLSEVQKCYPGIKLTINTGLSYTLHDWLRNGRVDLAISYLDGSDMSNIHRELLLEENIYLAVSTNPINSNQKNIIKHKTIEFSELANHEIMVTERKDALGYLLHQYEVEADIEIKKETSVDLLMTALRLASEGYKMLIVPSSATFHLEELNQIKCIEIVNPQITREAYLMTSIDRPQSNALTLVMGLVKKVTIEAHKKSHWRGKIPNKNNLF
jgi:LysR family nitrogen assimilation transcriptional regulator